ncbi:hypothetical protein Tco_0118618, partial [Tanacetum coccineum]
FRGIKTLPQLQAHEALSIPFQDSMVEVLHVYRFASPSKWRIWKIGPANNESGLSKVKTWVDGRTYGNRSSTGAEKVMTGCLIFGRPMLKSKQEK